MAHRLYPNIAVVPDGQQPVYATSEVSHFYADGTSGSDLNDGLTVGSPVQTIPRVMELLPDVIKHNTVVHMTGTFDLQPLPSIISISKQLANASKLIFDGGDSVIEAAPGSTGLAISGSTTGSITVFGAGWTVNQWAGYWAKVSTGQIRLIRNNTADTIYTTSFFSAAPSGTFDIVQPETAITSSSNRILWDECFGSGSTRYQRLRFLSSSRFYASTKGVETYLHAVMINSTSIYALVNWGYGATPFVCGQNPIDPANPSAYLLNIKIGLSMFNGTARTTGTSAATFGDSYINKLVSSGGTVYGIVNGNHFKSIKLITTRFTNIFTLFADDGGATSATTIVVGSVDIGFLLQDSAEAPTIKASRLDISGCASHAIEVKNAAITFEGVVTGSGNGGVGLYAHQGSQVTIAGATPPTVTGTLGDVAVNNPILLTTWANIVSNGGLSSAQEATTVKVS